MQSPIEAPQGCLDFGCFALDLDSRLLIDPSGHGVALRRREFDLLVTLARSPGRVMSRSALLDAIAGREAEAFDRTIDVHVGRLRRKIEADPKQPRLIVTVPGVGYRLAAKVKPTQASGPDDADRHHADWPVRAGVGIVAAFNKANMERDFGAVAAIYTRDAVMIACGKPLSGRAAIEKWLAGNRDHDDYNPDPSKLEHATALGDNVMLRSGSWSATCQGESGPVHRRGYWTTTDVRDGATWKIRTETAWMAPPARWTRLAGD